MNQQWNRLGSNNKIHLNQRWCICVSIVALVYLLGELLNSQKSVMGSAELKTSILLKTETLSIDKSNQKHFCINSDFSPSFHTSIWTSFPETIDDLQSVLVLGESLSNESTSFDLVLFGTKDFSEDERIRLRTVWTHFCQLEQNISKILSYSLWGMTVYNRIMYISPHSMVLNVRQLLKIFTLPLYTFTSSSNEHLPLLGLSGDQLWTFHPNQGELDRVSCESRYLHDIYHNRSIDLGAFAILATTYDSRPHLERDNSTNSSHVTGNTILNVTSTNTSSTQSVIYWKKEFPPWQMCIQQRRGYYKDNEISSCQLWVQLYDKIYADQSMPCVNLDFVSNLKYHQHQQQNQHIAIVTMNTGDSTQLSDFVDAAVMLGVSLRQHTSPTIVFDMVHMELASQPIPSSYWKILEQVGWKRCLVNRIPPPASHEPRQRYKDQFTKLHVWRMTEYTSILYLDSDCWVLGSIDQLLLGEATFQSKNGTKILVARDFIMDKTRHGWVDTFNMGVFLIHPQKSEFDRLMQLRDDDLIEYESELSEQGWLNVIYENQWMELATIFNTNILAIRVGAISPTDDIRILHFTSPKMFFSCRQRQFRRIRHYCDAWKAALATYKSNHSIYSRASP
jgi:alpha-N-acetylglucosamine transferase